MLFEEGLRTRDRKWRNLLYIHMNGALCAAHHASALMHRRRKPPRPPVAASMRPKRRGRTEAPQDGGWGPGSRMSSSAYSTSLEQRTREESIGYGFIACDATPYPGERFACNRDPYSPYCAYTILLTVAQRRSQYRI